MIIRIAATRLLELAVLFKAVAVVGPRQSDKASMVKSVFPDKPYVSLSEEKGRYIITCSSNFLIQESISQSMAGRVAYL